MPRRTPEQLALHYDNLARVNARKARIARDPVFAQAVKLRAMMNDAPSTVHIAELVIALDAYLGEDPEGL